MPPAKRMRLAVLDGHDEPIIVWDDNEIAQALFARLLANEIGLRVQVTLVRKRWRLGLRRELVHEKLSEDDKQAIHDATTQALWKLSRQVARL